ncbi:MAG: hypothetical protein HY392_00185 [Candidatus Diapherotrites archaeon]|nr:hypothetical protein [Candidatus Diapherotrites archaeon]
MIFMLEDFILANKLTARFFESEEELTTPAKRAKICGLPAEDATMTVLLIHLESMEAILAVFLARDALSVKKLEKASGLRNLKLADNDETFEITGYEKNHLPPVSVYGVKTFVDRKILGKKLVCSPGGGKFHALSINPSEIIEHSYDATAADISE